jgi:hypothetical protein
MRTKTTDVRKRAWSSRLSRNVLKALIAAPTAGQIIFGAGAEASELDVVSCRSFALQKAARIPVADLLDRVEAFNGPDFDLFFIDERWPNLTDPPMFYAYAGPRWYGRELTAWTNGAFGANRDPSMRPVSSQSSGHHDTSQDRRSRQFTIA